MNKKLNLPKLKLRKVPDPILRKVSKPVKNFDQDLIKLINALKKYIKVNEALDVSTVGMSAVQVGVLKRACVCYNEKTKKIYTFINPEVIKSSKKITGCWEACASVGSGGDQLFAKVFRPDKITVKYHDEKGVLRKRKASGFFAHVILHEIDHMNGILFIDRVPKEKIWKYKDLKQYIDKHKKYPPY